MSLASGTQLASYEILSPLGAGGMGEVYLARDTKLGREVAIKVLPDAFTKDAERLARFEREARLLASLNHPNIGSIYGLEESDGTRFLVLELVPGETLEDIITHPTVGATLRGRPSAAESLGRPLRAAPTSGADIARGRQYPLDIDDALKICSQIAEALEAAHEKGIIHRDLKPANVKVTPEGKVKVRTLAISPDGRHLAFVSTSEGRSLLWIRSFDSITARPLAGTEDAYLPFWSPDSRSIGFFAAGKLKRIEVNGGPAQTLCDISLDGRGGTWNQDGIIVFSPDFQKELYKISSAGGVAAPLTKLDSSRQETSHRFPYFLADGRHFVYLARCTVPENSGLYIGSLESKETKRVLAAESSAAYAAGNLLFVRRRTLIAQPFDLVQGTEPQMNVDTHEKARFVMGHSSFVPTDD